MSSIIRAAKRTEGVTYAIRDIVVLASEVAKTGKEMLYLNIGDPNIYDHRTPQHVIEATYKAMSDNKNGYSPSSGVQEALDSIRRDADKKGIKNIRDIFITTGASEAIELCLTALADEGENVLLPTPGYPLYTAIQAKLGLEANPYYMDENNNWEPDIDDIKKKINSKTRAIVLINPNNPTGTVYSAATLQKIIDLALEYDLVIFADEIYDKLVFDGKKHTAIASLNDEVPVITFSGMSKNYVVPGWRIGWGIASGNKERMQPFLDALNKLLRARLCANHPMQYAIPAALDGDQSHLQSLIKTLEYRRNITMEKLATIPGISLVKPEGAFYAFASIDVDDDMKFSAELIKATGVVIVPGSGFGQKPGTHHFRIVILPQEEVLTKAFERIASFYEQYKKRN
jgi:alanine-synthesizing transaminase